MSSGKYHIIAVIIYNSFVFFEKINAVFSDYSLEFWGFVYVKG